MELATTSYPHSDDRPALLDFAHASLTYANGTQAVSDITLSVRRGEFVSIVGPSGCGKSTLLRMAAGLETVTLGQLVTSTNRIGYVFQDATLLPWRNVLGNVELLCELQGLDATRRRQLALSALELVWLRGFEEHLPKQLSGGMRMRVSLARALTLDPDLFLFDEPFGALDEISRENLQDELMKLFCQKEFAGLFITHSVTEAVYLSSRVIVLSSGPGTITDSFDIPFGYPRDPELRFSARFAGIVGDISRSLKNGRH